MLSHSANINQKNLLYQNLLDQLNPKSPLLQLSKAIPWDYFEAEFSCLYSHKGKPAKPIRLMVGLSILKHLENLINIKFIVCMNPIYIACRKESYTSVMSLAQKFQ